MLAALQQQIARLSTKAAGAGDKAYKFWSTQPVPGLHEQPTECGPIEVKTVDAIHPTPYPLPTGFEWSDVDMTDEAQSLEVYRLLNENYVEDDDNMFRFDYSQAFLQWALLPPHWTRELHIGVRMSGGSRKLVGFITGIPQRMRVYRSELPMVEINFLCVHKKLRSKRLAPVLIKEVTRRVNRTNVWQAVYTAGVVLPKPVSSTRYWHRSLQVKKLDRRALHAPAEEHDAHAHHQAVQGQRAAAAGRHPRHAAAGRAARAPPAGGAPRALLPHAHLHGGRGAALAAAARRRGVRLRGVLGQGQAHRPLLLLQPAVHRHRAPGAQRAQGGLLLLPTSPRRTPWWSSWRTR